MTIVLRCAAIGIALGFCVPAAARTTLQLEVLAATQQRNRVQAPNDASATRFALDDLTGDGPFYTARVEAGFRLRERQEWRVLVQPLTVDEPGALATAVRFQGATFAAGPVDAKYRFDSYRVGWRWLWIDRPALTVRLGATAKLRDAEIELRQGNLRARKSNTGFVPLAHASFERRFGARGFIAGDIDALGGGPGYAIDAGLYAGRALSDQWSAYAGLRFLDGGADNDEVYTFARFTSAAVGLRYRW
ncbi:MAG: hypothetical protein NZM12_11485 [Steroidobacteraceae bacterium]|nr:hypothetical protein [Steroidobacteraceae bacterium]MDW8258043.1 hypothetical protein [Gammaproteobacteria bacterium]